MDIEMTGPEAKANSVPLQLENGINLGATGKKVFGNRISMPINRFEGSAAIILKIFRQVV